jgi:cytochrome P450
MSQTVRSAMDQAPAYPFRRDPQRPLDPAPELMALLRERPISKVTLWNGKKVWLVTRLEDVRQVLGSSHFTATASHENTPSVSAAVEARKNLDTSFQRKDAPEHTRERRLWQPFFSAANIEAIRPAIQRYVDDAIDSLLDKGSPADLIEHVAMIVPQRTICDLLAIPEEDRAFFVRESLVLANSGASLEDVSNSSRRLSSYWHTLVEKRLNRPGDDFVSHLISREVKGGSLTKDEVVSGALLIQFAGQHTTANSIGLGTVTLLERPDLIERMKVDPSITPRVVEELFRYLTIVHNGIARVALEDVIIGGQKIGKGEGLIAHLSTANRDEVVFQKADRIDPDRPARAHMAFGSGSHICIGAPLARAELQIVFDTLFRRIPTLRLALPTVQASYKSDGLFFGLHSLPVAWQVS